MRLEEVTLYAMDIKAFNLDPLLENATLLKNLRNLNIRAAWNSDMAVENAIQGSGFACLNNVTIDCGFRSLKNDLRLLSIFSSQSNSRLESLRIIHAQRRRKTFERDIARAFMSLQCAAVFKSLRSLHIDSEEAADRWLDWIVPYCSSLESLSIAEGRTFWRSSVPRAPSFPQIPIVFDRLRTLHINSGNAADLWLKWIGPCCSDLQSLTLVTEVIQTPDTLNLIPITIQILDLALWSKWASSEELTGWMRCLLNIVSSVHFPKLKSFTLFISKDDLRHMESGIEMQNFKEKMSAVCEGVGVKCYLNL